jgi:hypothetical protein
VRAVAAKPLKALGQQVFGDTNTNTIRSGNWYGNDTTWRMVLDLNRILMYADPNGRLQDRPARRVFCIVDGIVGGEGNGPLDPMPKGSSVVIAGANPVAVDLACAKLMGFNYQRLPMLSQGLAAHPLPLVTFVYDDVVCARNDTTFQGRLAEMEGLNLHFQPHFGWLGHVERTCPGRQRSDRPCVG